MICWFFFMPLKKILYWLALKVIIIICCNTVYFLFAGSPYPYSRPQLKTTARVLPGGQLQLADDQADGPDSGSLQPVRRPSSWHGKTFDFVDLILDSYDIVDNGDSSNVDSMSVSHNSILSSSQGTWKADSLSDDGIEVDIDERLSEYTIISASPSPPPLSTDTRDMKKYHANEANEQTNHRKLDNNKRLNSTASNNYEDGANSAVSSTMMSESKFATESTFGSSSGFHHSDSYSACSDSDT